MKFKKIEYATDRKTFFITPSFGFTIYSQERIFWFAWTFFLFTLTFEKVEE